MPTDTLPAAVWVCTVRGCDYTTDVPPACATYVSHLTRGTKRTAHEMRRVLPDPSVAPEPGRTTVARHP